MDTKLLIINYHYVREFFPTRGIYGITQENLRNQLLKVEASGFAFISLSQLNTAIESQELGLLKGKVCLVTFDDGFKESYEAGNLILREFGIEAAFFISSGTIGQSKVLDVHKYHYIQSVMTNQEIIEAIGSDFFRLDIVKYSAVAVAQYPWDDLESARLKYYINFIIDNSEKLELVNSIFHNLVSSEDIYAKELYMDPHQVLDLAKKDAVGSHGISHHPLTKLSKIEMREEISGSRVQLSQTLKSNVSSISYPYGGISAISYEVIKSAADAGYTSGFTMSRGINTGHEILRNPLELKRFDTNDVFGGKSSHLFKEILGD